MPRERPLTCDDVFQWCALVTVVSRCPATLALHAAGLPSPPLHPRGYSLVPVSPIGHVSDSAPPRSTLAMTARPVEVEVGGRWYDGGEALGPRRRRRPGSEAAREARPSTTVGGGDVRERSSHESTCRPAPRRSYPQVVDETWVRQPPSRRFFDVPKLGSDQPDGAYHR